MNEPTEEQKNEIWRLNCQGLSCHYAAKETGLPYWVCQEVIEEKLRKDNDEMYNN